MAVEGRWKIWTGPSGPQISGYRDQLWKCVTAVVPCDDPTVERASYALCTLPPEWLAAIVNGDTDRDYPRLVAEAVLEAAGGQDGC